MKTYIVLIPVEINNSRKICEFIENSEIVLPTNCPDESRKANVCKEWLKEQIEKRFGSDWNIVDEDLFHIQTLPISDFMELCNDQETNLEDYFMSYVIGTN